jgi:tetratricopeptide (TPR) repeat protein/DNA-binding CsgD family transcriptional regulator
MYKKLSFILLFATAIGFSQTGRYNFEKAEKDARKLISSSPDEALVLIKKTLSQPGLHDTVYGKTYNLYGMYYGITGKPDSLIYYEAKSLDYLDKYPELAVKSLMNLSIGYRNKTAYTTAIDVLKSALELHTKNKDKVGIATAYGELATNYSYMQNYKEAVAYLLRGIAILKAEKNTDKLVAIKQKLANTYMAMGNYKFAIDLNRECAAAFKKANDLNNYYLTLINLGESLTAINSYTESEKVLTDALAGLKGYGDKELIGITLAQLGALKVKQAGPAAALGFYSQAVDNLIAAKSGWITGIAGRYVVALNKSGDYKTALSIIEKVNSLNLYPKANAQDQLEYKNALADAFTASGKTKQAITAYQDALALMDTISRRKQEVALQEIQAKYQTVIQREKNLALASNNEVLKKDIAAEKTFMWVYIIAGFIIIMYILLVLRGYLLKNRLQKEELKIVASEKALIQQQHLHEQELTNAQREIIEEKQRELTSSALRMANFQDSVNELIARCDSQAITKVSEAKKELTLLVKQQDYWKQFETRFNHLHPEFGATLVNKFDKLTKNDIEFCSLLKLNLSNKEIASLLQISHESVITKKYRIKKKMEINDDDEFERLLTEI